MCDLTRHEWQFDGDLIFCKNCSLQFTKSVEWVKFNEGEKKLLNDALMESAVRKMESFTISLL